MYTAAVITISDKGAIGERIDTSGPNLVNILKEHDYDVVFITNFHTNEVLYVGKTTKLRRRLYTNHLMGNLATARLKKYLIDDIRITDVSDLSSAKQYIKDNCYFQYVVEPDMRKRGQLEGLFSYLLNVRYVDKEH